MQSTLEKKAPQAAGPGPWRSGRWLGGLTLGSPPSCSPQGSQIGCRGGGAVVLELPTKADRPVPILLPTPAPLGFTSPSDVDTKVGRCLTELRGGGRHGPRAGKSCRPQPEFPGLEGYDPTAEFLHPEGPAAPGDTRKGWLCQERLFLLALEAVGDFGGLCGGGKGTPVWTLSSHPTLTNSRCLPPTPSALPFHFGLVSIQQPWDEGEWL